jgi:hypothetical protein
MHETPCGGLGFTAFRSLLEPLRRLVGELRMNIFCSAALALIAKMANLWAAANLA